jgi:hypothetical protein
MRRLAAGMLWISIQQNWGFRRLLHCHARPRAPQNKLAGLFAQVALNWIRTAFEEVDVAGVDALSELRVIRSIRPLTSDSSQTIQDSFKG